MTLLFGPYLEQILRGYYTYSRKGSEPDEVRAALGDLDNPQGASAGDSSSVVTYLNALDHLEHFKPDCVLMHVGTHDIKRNVESKEAQVTIEDYAENVETIVTWFARKKIEFIWIRNGPIDETLHNARSKSFHRFEAGMHAYNEAAEAILEPNHVTMLDLPIFMKNLGPMSELLKDHLHYKGDVVRQQAAFIAGYLIGRI